MPDQPSVRRGLEPARGEVGCLSGHPVHRISGVREGWGGATAVADGVAVGTQLDRLGPIQRADGDLRRVVLAEELR